MTFQEAVARGEALAREARELAVRELGDERRRLRRKRDPYEAARLAQTEAMLDRYAAIAKAEGQ